MSLHGCDFRINQPQANALHIEITGTGSDADKDENGGNYFDHLV